MDSRSQLGMAAINPMFLQQTLRGLCSNESHWVYAVFWRILPRNYPPPQWDTEDGIMDRSKGNKRNWILVWEDGYCNFSACSGTTKDSRGLRSSFLSVQHHSISSDDQQLEDMNPELFFKMSHEVYNYGEGLIGKVAVDNSHKWVYQEPLENELGFFSPWHGSIDSHPRTWEGQFKSGIQTIAVVGVQEGVLQLGSTKKIMEDLNFVLYMQCKFNFLHLVPSVFVPHSAPLGGATKRGNGPPSPSEDVSATTNNQLNVTRSNDQFQLPGVAPDPWCPMVTPVAGKKRTKGPSEISELLIPNQYSYLNSGPSFDQYTQQGSPSPEDLHTFVPSMSSLQALLSKLPNVTVPLDNSNCCSLSSNGNFEVIDSAGLNGFNNNLLPAMSSDGSNLQRMMEGECIVTSPTNYSIVRNHVGEDLEVHPQNYRNTVGKEKRWYNSMFDSFDNFTEFGIQEALEGGDSSYTSFLNKICN